MCGLRGAQLGRRRIGRLLALGLIPGFRNDQALPMIECKPCFPLGVAHAAIRQRLSKRRQRLPDIGMLFQDRPHAPFAGCRARHIADEMHNGVAARDIVVEHFQRFAAQRLEIFLIFHVDVRPREIGAQLFPIEFELAGNGRKKNLHRHWRVPAFKIDGGISHVFLGGQNRRGDPSLRTAAPQQLPVPTDPGKGRSSFGRQRSLMGRL